MAAINCQVFSIARPVSPPDCTWCSSGGTESGCAHYSGNQTISLSPSSFPVPRSHLLDLVSPTRTHTQIWTTLKGNHIHGWVDARLIQLGHSGGSRMLRSSRRTLVLMAKDALHHTPHRLHPGQRCYIKLLLGFRRGTTPTKSHRLGPNKPASVCPRSGRLVPLDSFTPDAIFRCSKWPSNERSS